MTSIVSLPAFSLYGNERVPIEFPGGWDVRIHSYNGEKAPALTRAQLQEALSAPECARPVYEDARGCGDAVIIIDDFSRPTPAGVLVRLIVEQLEEAGVPRGKIRVIAATGMHRAMNREDFVRKLDEDLVSEFRTYSHNPFFNNVQVGISSYGIPIELNAECVRADYKVGIGSIFAHPATGLGGAGKLILPGISSMETIRRFHLMASAVRWDTGLDSRKLTLEAAEMLGLNIKLDALLNGGGEIAKLYAGDCRRNVDNHIEEIKDFYTVQWPDPARLVIANNYFKPTEPGLAFCYPEFWSLVEPGGDVVVAAHTPNGAAAHYLFGRWGDSGGGGLMYTGENRLPDSVGRYFAFSRFIDGGTALPYHFDSSDERFHWAGDWRQIRADLGDSPRSVLVLPYATVPFFRNARSDA
ncbi:MAG: lactate racemase domain-containing protein [Oscillospiraceae bacterium]|jgi:hypothetical protein|nr:lactate racemase domain-containing protein [Oscillospiraceae bacterium]